MHDVLLGPAARVPIDSLETIPQDPDISRVRLRPNAYKAPFYPSEYRPYMGGLKDVMTDPYVNIAFDASAAVIGVMGMVTLSGVWSLLAGALGGWGVAKTLVGVEGIMRERRTADVAEFRETMEF